MENIPGDAPEPVDPDRHLWFTTGFADSVNEGRSQELQELQESELGIAAVSGRAALQHL